MVPENTGNGPTRRPRGRPPGSTKHKTSPGNSVLDPKGREGSLKGQDVASATILTSAHFKPEIMQVKPIQPVNIELDSPEIRTQADFKPPRAPITTVTGAISTHPEIPEGVPEKTLEDRELDAIVFTNGNNTLKMTFRQKDNRICNMKIYLNDTTEIRPVTYNGLHTGKTYWNLLKASLK
jgi:hypothetical protein